MDRLAVKTCECNSPLYKRDPRGRNMMVIPPTLHYEKFVFRLNEADILR